MVMQTPAVRRRAFANFREWAALNRFFSLPAFLASEGPRYLAFLAFLIQLLLCLFMFRLTLLPSTAHLKWLKLHPTFDFIYFLMTVWWFAVLPHSRMFESLRQGIRNAMTWGLGELLSWLPGWYRPHGVNSTLRVAAQLCKQSLRFTAACVVSAAIPDWWKIPVNDSPLRFIDANNDGIIQANEIEGWLLGIVKKIYAAACTWDICRYVLDLLHLPGGLRPPKDTRDKHFVTRFFQQKMRSGPTGRAVVADRLITAVLYCIAVLPWLGVLGLDVQTVFALGGVGGLAVGLASKNVVGNGIAGILIFLQRSFSEGEEIEVRSRKIRGFVARIGLTNTVVNQRDGMPICVPNSVLLDDALVNHSTKYFRVIEERVPVIISRVNELSALLEEAGRTLAEHPDVLSSEEVKALKDRMEGKAAVYPPIICFEGMGERGFSLYVRAYVRGDITTDAFLRKKSDILIKINAVITKHGGYFAFPVLSSWKEDTDQPGVQVAVGTDVDGQAAVLKEWKKRDGQQG